MPASDHNTTSHSEPAVHSALPDIAHLTLRQLRDADADALRAGVDRVLRRSQPSEPWLASASRRFD